MIYRDNFAILSKEQESRYKFEFCRLCEFYPCELVGEYAQFRDSHTQNSKPSIQQTGSHTDGVSSSCATGSRVIIHATATPIDTGSPSRGLHVAPSSEPQVAALLSYNQEELQDGCIMSGRHVTQVECGRQRVAEGIGDHYKIETQWDYTIRAGTTDRWEPSQPVFISAQTGQGKNFFIERTLIPYVEDLNGENNTEQRVLILSNRLALREQIKHRLANGDDAEIEYDPEEDMKTYHPYGPYADVITYQSLLRRAKDLDWVREQKYAHSRYIYVICDEAHFFTSDAMFNPHTAKILSTIVELFQDAIRVYMSATPYECLEYIIKEEDDYKREYLNWGKPQHKGTTAQMVFYHFKRDYSYLDVKTYSSIAEDLVAQIVKSVHWDKKRWLIFIDDKQKCADTKRQLEEYGAKNSCPMIVKGADGKVKEKILVVSAESKKKPAYRDIVKKEELSGDTYVLITTSVLDNGVNLKGIDNIVVSDMSKVKCLQMAGRARVTVDDPTDRKTLYIKRFGGDEVRRRIDALNQQRYAYNSYTSAYGELSDLNQSRGRSEHRFLDKYNDGSVKDWMNSKHWFGRSLDNPKELYPNEIAKSLVNKLIRQYRAILEEMLKESDALTESERKDRVNRTGQIYLEHQLSWFGKTYHLEDDLAFAGNVIENRPLVAFLEQYAESGEEIEGSEKMKVFQAEFKRLHDTVYPCVKKDKTHSYGHKVMNDILRDRSMGYEITGRPNNGPWRVIRVDANQERPESEQTAPSTIEDPSDSLE